MYNFQANDYKKRAHKAIKIKISIKEKHTYQLHQQQLPFGIAIVVYCCSSAVVVDD